MSKVTADRVIAIAKSYVGYHEKKSDAQLESKTANAGSGNYTKFNKLMHQLQPSNMDYPAPWCDAFVDACVLEAADSDVKKAKYVLCGDFDDYTVASANLYRKAGRFDKTPKRGDQIFFKNSGGINHTGIVTEVTALMVKTVEGNSGNMVAEHSYLRSSLKIAGYGHPRYDSPAHASTTPSKPASTAAKKTIAEIAQEVVDGKWGVGEARKKKLEAAGYDYKTVQSKVNEILNAKKGDPFPLPQGHWYGPRKNDVRAHSGYVNGDDSKAIKKIQGKVDVAVDGLYGPKTTAAVKKWQKAHGLTADGEAGVKTWTKMFG